jgi:hypothetical protein
MNSGLQEGRHNALLHGTLIKAFEEEDDEESNKILCEHLEKRKKTLPVNNDELPIPTGEKFYLTKASDIRHRLAFPQSIIPRTLSCSFAKRAKQNLNEVSFELQENTLVIKWKEDEDTITINCGLDGRYGKSHCQIKGYPYEIWAYAYQENGVVRVVAKPINTLSTRFIDISFKGKKLKMKFGGEPDFTGFLVKSVLELDFIRNNKVIKAIVLFIVRRLCAFLESPMKFKKGN